jgi:hypothetical protein
MAQAPAGWYPQPDGTQRYWDGTAWTEHIHGTPSAAADAAPPAAAAPAADAVPSTDAPAPKTKSAAKSKAKASGLAPAESGAVDASAAEPVVIASSDDAKTYGIAADPVHSAATISVPSDLSASGKPKRKVWPIVLGVVGAIVLVVVLAIVALVFVIKGATDGPNTAVANYDTAWKTVDCELMQGSTTEYFREQNGYLDCASFESNAQEFADTLGTYDVKIYSTSIENGSAEVRTTETWVNTDGETSTYDYTYILVKDGDAWLIDELQDS